MILATAKVQTPFGIEKLEKYILKLPKLVSKNMLNQSTIEECLQTLDIFKEIMQDKIQKKKIVKDVLRNIKLFQYDVDSILYHKGDIAQQIYLLIKGKVSICRPIFKEEEQNTFEYQEVNSFERSQGFGEGQFIQSKRRGLTAIIRESSAIIGTIEAKSFQQIIQNYKKRVYQNKIQMFMSCALLKNLQRNQIQFIVNNAKPTSFFISKKIFNKGQRVKSLYLIIKGQVELFDFQKSLSSRGSKYEKKSLKVGIVEAGSFIGDYELALSQCYEYTAVCKTERVQAYACDQRIIMSQMNNLLLEEALKFYSAKKQYYFHIRKKNLLMRNKIKNQSNLSEQVELNPQQIQIKKRIRARYNQKTLTLIDQCSPKEISRMIDRKKARIKTQPQSKKLPLIFFEQKKINKKQMKTCEIKKKNTQQNGFKNKTFKYFQPTAPTSQIDYLLNNENNYYDFHLAIIEPYHNKVISLHQRLANEERFKRINEKKQYPQNLNPKYRKRINQFLIQIKNKRMNTIQD